MTMEKPEGLNGFDRDEWNLYVSRTRQAILARIMRSKSPTSSSSSSSSANTTSTSTRPKLVICDDDQDTLIHGSCGIVRLHGFDLDTSQIDSSYIQLMTSLPCMGNGQLIVLVSDYNDLGLYVTRRFGIGETITTYGGRAIHTETLKESDEKSYKIRVPDANYYLDGKQFRYSFGRPFSLDIKQQRALPPCSRRKWVSSYNVLWKGIGFMSNHHNMPNVAIKVIPVVPGLG